MQKVIHTLSEKKTNKNGKPYATIYFEDGSEAICMDMVVADIAAQSFGKPMDVNITSWNGKNWIHPPKGGASHSVSGATNPTIPSKGMSKEEWAEKDKRKSDEIIVAESVKFATIIVATHPAFAMLKKHEEFGAAITPLASEIRSVIKGMLFLKEDEI